MCYDMVSQQATIRQTHIYLEQLQVNNYIKEIAANKCAQHIGKYRISLTKLASQWVATYTPYVISLVLLKTPVLPITAEKHK